MRARVAMGLLLVAPSAWCWQLAVGGGLVIGRLSGAYGATAPARGWAVTTMVDERPLVGQRLLFMAAWQQLATPPINQGVVAGVHLMRVTMGWQWRWPISYRLRPWLGVGAGLMSMHIYHRIATNSDGYAVAYDRALRVVGVVLAATTMIPINHDTEITAAVLSAPGRGLSIVDVGVLWTLF